MHKAIKKNGGTTITAMSNKIHTMAVQIESKIARHENESGEANNDNRARRNDSNHDLLVKSSMMVALLLKLKKKKCAQNIHARDNPNIMAEANGIFS